MSNLSCRISEGQFSCEKAVSFADSEGRGVSFFCPNELVGANSVKVRVIDRCGGLCVVHLPREGLESGKRYATVRASQITS